MAEILAAALASRGKRRTLGEVSALRRSSRTGYRRWQQQGAISHAPDRPCACPREGRTPAAAPASGSPEKGLLSFLL